MSIDKLFEDPRWYFGTTAIERIQSLWRQHDSGSHRARTFPRLRPPFSPDSLFAQTLKYYGIGQAEFKELAGGSAASIKDLFPAPLAWLAELKAAFSVKLTAQEKRELEEGAFSQGPIESFGAPLIRRARHRLRERLQELKGRVTDLPFDLLDVTERFEPSLRSCLVEVGARAIVLELNIARLRGRLRGDSPEARFKYFAKQMGDSRRALQFLLLYPVIARLVVQCIDQWVSTSFEFIERLCIDWKSIVATLNAGENPGNLIAINSGVGDRHNSGRTVMIATFASGFRLVYKPRSLEVDNHFQDLLLWLNDRGLDPPFRRLKILTRANYGWTDFISQKACACEHEVERFYLRQGAYLAILYILGAKDFHYENLIAAGEHPMLVDLEGLLHPRLDDGNATLADNIAQSTVRHSVLGTGMLPSRLGGTPDFDGIDLSGLGAGAGQMTPFTIPVWSDAGTDEMRLRRERVSDSGAQNRPSFLGKEVDVVAYGESLITGFIDAYRFMSSRREELLSASGPIARFADDEIRVILRPTKTYAMLLYESYHPDAVADGSERDSFFGRLWAKVEQCPYLAEIVPFEKVALWNGDVPKFTSKAGSRDVFATSGERIAGLLDAPSLEITLNNIQQLSEQDMARQIWIIRSSLSSVDSVSAAVQRRDCGSLNNIAPVSRQDFLDAAIAVGEHLEAWAIRGDDDATWLSVDGVNPHSFSLAPVQLNLYDGLPGVILFLAYLGSQTGATRYKELARAGMRALRRQLHKYPESVSSIGGFVGWGGLIYTFNQLGLLWAEPTLVAEAEKIALSKASPLIARDSQFDVSDGAAGLMLALLNLHDCSSSEFVLAAAIQCGEHLEAHAQRVAEDKLAWRPIGESAMPLTGLSHGAAGIAWALLRLSAATGEPKFRKLAMDAIAYERSLFSSEQGNWPDLRAIKAGTVAGGYQCGYPVAWCHGASGVGQARLASLPYLDDQRMRAEIDVAIQTTCKHGFGNNHSLCHGDLGNVELLLQARKKLKQGYLEGMCDTAAAQILNGMRRDGWRCGSVSGLESPGLMTGISGIGYQLLRLADPSAIPSVLSLEPLERAPGSDPAGLGVFTLGAPARVASE
jgi:type 2 lantibiotic biosynthesis protein LanM